jgi:Ni,Fe-hydrogenase I cytochrome b subunit
VSGPDVAAWLATVLLGATAAIGLVLRRRAAGTFARRMRPHFVLGYAVFGLALVHVALSTGGMHLLSRADLWIATFALFGVLVQTFVGLSLQAPGAYRRPLRRWHVATFWTVSALVTAHVVLTFV